MHAMQCMGMHGNHAVLSESYIYKQVFVIHYSQYLLQY